MSSRMGETTTTHSTNEKCPECGKPMSWTEGLLKHGSRDKGVGRFSCRPCGLFKTPGDSREIREGKAMASEFVGQRNVVKKIMRFSGTVQLGILRALQHCKTCENDAGDPCTCEGKCSCPHCLDRGNYKGK